MRIVFMGTGEVGLLTLDWLLSSPRHEVVGVVTQPDKPVGRKQVLTPPAPKLRAQQAGVPVLQPLRVRRPEEVEAIRQLRPEAIVVIAYGQILSQELLDVPAVACLNLHASLLPRHRGAAPINAAILAGDLETGMTLMFMDAGLDTGDVLLQRKIEIGPRETAGELHDRLAMLAPQVLEEGLDLLANGTVPRTPQVAAEATLTGKLSRESGALHWSLTAGHLDRLVRAMHPWPGAFMLLPDGRRCKVLAATATDDPGKIAAIERVDDAGILVGTASGCLLVQELQVEGKNRMSARDFLRGNPLRGGQWLPFPA